MAATALRNAVRSRLVPALIAEDFLPLPDAERTLRFRRPHGEVAHLLEVQWDHHDRPRYVVNYATCPADGLAVGDRRFPVEAVFAGWLPDSGRLQPRPGPTTAAWFRGDLAWPLRLLGRRAPAPDAVVDASVALLPELWRYWREGRPGPHMHACPPASRAPADA